MTAVLDAALVAKGALATLGMMAVQGTVLAVIALVLVRGGRLRPAWQAAVWLVVLAKFVLPWGPSMPFSLADVIALLTGSTPAGGAVVLAPATGAAPAGAPAIGPALAWLALAAAWLGGAALVLARGLGAYRHTLRAARAGAPAPAPARALLAELAVRVRVRAPRLVVGAPSVGPHVVGAFRPIIVIPPALVDDPVLLRAALLHELAHVRRRDAFGRLIQLLAVAAHWWLPVVRLASRRLELARECACDAWALEASDIARPAYARLLVRMAQLRVGAATALAAPHTLDARVAAVLGEAARPRLGVVHRIALLAWMLLALGGARSASAARKGEVCVYTPAYAAALREAYPEADLDGDGVLSREEACDFQAELRRQQEAEPMFSTQEAPRSELLAEPLCCNCDESLGPSGPLSSSDDASCRNEEGVYR